MVDSPLASNTTVENAPDRFDAAKFGELVCELGLKGNLCTAHPTQQDRVSAYPVNIHPSQFGRVIGDVFKAMAEKYKLFKEADRGFIGDACATMLMFDPVHCKASIGSKGDAKAYIVLQHKTDPSKVIIQRISNPYTKVHENTGTSLNPFYVNSIGVAAPVMWANSKSWHEQHEKGFTPGASKPTYCETLNLAQISKDIITDHNQKALETYAREHPKKNFFGIGKPQPENLDDYTASLIVTTDGITNGIKNSRSGYSELEFLRAAIAKVGNAQNLAQALAELVSMEAEKSGLARPSLDNIGLIVIRNITLGHASGETISAVTVDANYQSEDMKVREQRMNEGNIIAQALIEVFEEQMKALITAEEERTRSTGKLASEIKRLTTPPER